MNFLSGLISNVLIVLPYAMAVLGFYLFLRTVYHVKAPVRPLFLWPIICSLVGTALFMLWGHYHIAMSPSSRWWLWHGFFPLYAVAVGLAGYVVAWILFYVFRFLIDWIWMISKKLRHSRP